MTILSKAEVNAIWDSLTPTGSGKSRYDIASDFEAAVLAKLREQEPVAFALRFPDDPRLCLSTVFDTEKEAKDYAEALSSKTEIVPLVPYATALPAVAQVPPLQQGKERQWVKCRTCGRVAHYDYVPYSLSSPIMTMPCGHGAGERDMGADCISEEEAARLLAAPEAPAQAVAQVPQEWRDFVTEVVASAEGYERRTGQKVNAEWVQRGRELLAAAPEAPAQAPIDMVLHCPACGMQHIDAPDERTPDWKNEPHRSHLCHGCGHIWRPADVPTNGVAAVKTKGKADSPAPEASAQAIPAAWVEAVKVASEALHRIDGWLKVRHMGGLMPEERAALAQLDALMKEQP